MEKRIKNVVLWCLIVLAVFYIIATIAFDVFTFKVFSFSNTKMKEQLIEMQEVIDYAEGYKKQNGVYPQTVENIKEDKDSKIKYSTYSNSECYKIKYKNLKTNKTKEYNRCKYEKNGFTISSSENYREDTK